MGWSWTVLVLAGCGRLAFDPLRDDASPTSADACVGLECQVVDCAASGQPPTSLSGTVYAPNGTLPLYGVRVYVPRDDPGPLASGAACEPCQALPGAPITQTRSAENGTFRLEGVPAGADIPLVITTGKWRRQITISNVPACVESPLTAEQTRLPATRTEGDMPRIAVTTGNADSNECLLRKIGIADTEINAMGSPASVHLYAGNGISTFTAGFAGGTGAFPAATSLWSSSSSLAAYDLVILSCEGNQNATTKPQTSLDAMKAYADGGGTIFATHWHNYWMSGAISPPGPEAQPAWSPIATWNTASTTISGTNIIDEVGNPKGAAFATWMLEVGGSTVRGEFPIEPLSARDTIISIDPAAATRWISATNPAVPQGFLFATPREVPASARCGKFLFSDMHTTASGPFIAAGYPMGCPNLAMPMTPQEKAITFMYFELAACD